MRGWVAKWPELKSLEATTEDTVVQHCERWLRSREADGERTAEG